MVSLKAKNVKTIVVTAKNGFTGTSVFDDIMQVLLANFDVYVAPPAKYHKAAIIDSLTHVSPGRHDLVLSLGGDGTLLNVVRQLGAQIPVLGVNLGGRGIINELELNDLPIAIQKLKTGDYHVESRTRLRSAAGKKRLLDALNEVYLARPHHNVTPSFSLRFLNQTMSSRMDGLIISTPTGSTGYSYSAGGPVVLESLKVFIITPVLPIYRIPPMVIPAQEVVVSSNSAFDVTIDGQQVFGAGAGEEIRITVAPNPAWFVRFTPKPFKQLTKLLSGNVIKQQ
jgi:NAD+ kinase